ncbi:hypothetical protein [Reyranella sp.]|uniref:hypothetical protein n=1 Tax=Reyranella sp. TaxID=1929291 RepID=UPI00122AE57C|nr:hypothetical protein [Reyranella sp.]TAJ82089.1 MAG: hypothetical protein EPO50_27735 [Reyranella sp.]
MIDVPMAYGSHHRITQSVNDVRVSLVPGPEVELTAFVVPDSGISNLSSLPSASITIHMDVPSARELLSQLIGMFQVQGWPLPREHR